MKCVPYHSIILSIVALYYCQHTTARNFAYANKDVQEISPELAAYKRQSLVIDYWINRDLSSARQKLAANKPEIKKTPEIYAYYLIDKVKLDFMMRRNTEVTALLDSAISLTEKSTPNVRAEIHYLVSVAYTTMSLYPPANKAFHAALALSQDQALLTKIHLQKAMMEAYDWQVSQAFKTLQKADSLIDLEEHQQDVLLAEHIRNYIVYRDNKLEEALRSTATLAKKSLLQKDTIVFKKAKALECHIYYHFGNYLPAIKGYKTLFSLAEKENNLLDQFKWAHDLSYAYRMMGMFDEAILYANKCLEICDVANYVIGKGDAYIRLYQVYHDNKQYGKEINAIENAMNIFSLFKYEYGIAEAENSFGNAYEMMGKLDSALQAYQKSLVFSRTQVLSTHVVPLYNVGNILVMKNEPKKAIPFLKESLDICNMQGIIGMKIRNLLALSEAASLMADHQKAIQLVLESEKLVNTTLYKRMIRDTYQTKAKVYAASKQYKKAYNAHQQFKILEDSLFNEKSNKQFANLEVKYETRKKQQENDLLKVDLLLEQSKSRAQTQIAIFIAALFLFASVIAIFIARSNQKLNKQNLLIDSQKEEISSRNDKIETLLREVHHRVKNNLQLISSLLDIDVSDDPADQSSHILLDSQGRVATMSLIHQNLYMSHDFTQIDLDDYVEQLVTQLLEIHAFQSKIALDINCDDIQFDIDTMVPLGLIITELVTNAFKYSMTPNDSYYLGISITENNQHECKLLVSDKGPDLPQPFSILTKVGYGLRLASRLSMQLSGTLQHSYHQGNHFSVVFNSQEDTNIVKI